MVVTGWTVAFCAVLFLYVLTTATLLGNYVKHISYLIALATVGAFREIYAMSGRN